MRTTHFTAMAVGLATLTAAIGGGAAAATRPHAAGTSTVLHYFQKNTSGTDTKSSDAFTDDDYVGTNAHHAAQWTASDHIVCTFPSSAAPNCSGQIASGGSMLLIAGKGGQGTFTIPIVGGTGNDLGAKGTLKVQDIGKSSNSNLTVTLTKT